MEKLLIFGSYVISFGLQILGYIIKSLGLYRIASKRGVTDSWIAWIPVASDWVLGSVVDDFESQKGSKRKFRVILLTLSIVATVLSLIVAYTMIGVMFAISDWLNEIPYDGDVLVALVYNVIIAPVMLLVIVYQALYYLCLYKTHEYIYPEKSVKYLVLSLVVPLAHSICLLKNSKRCEEKPVVGSVPPEV